MRETKGERILYGILKIILIVFIILAWVAACGAVKRDRSTASGAVAQIQAESYPKYSGVTEYEIKANDTLLSIAYKMCPEGSPAEVYYKYADAVRRLNGRETDIIYFKETIKIYTFGEDGR